MNIITSAANAAPMNESVALEAQIAANEGRASPRPGKLDGAELAVFRYWLPTIVRETREARARSQARGSAIARPAPRPSSGTAAASITATLRASLPPAERPGFDARLAAIRVGGYGAPPSGTAALPPPAAPSSRDGWLTLASLSAHERASLGRFGTDPIEYLATRRMQSDRSAAERAAGRLVREALYADARTRSRNRAPKRTHAESAAMAERIERQVAEHGARHGARP